MPPAPHQDRATTERIARHKRICAELAELGMLLAEAAARQALANLNDPDESSACTADPTLTFVRRSRAVRQAIALELRVAEGREADQTRETEIAFDRAAAAVAKARLRAEPTIEGRRFNIPDFLNPPDSPAPDLFAAISRALDRRPPDKS